jgi:hypothetical protein
MIPPNRRPDWPLAIFCLALLAATAAAAATTWQSSQHAHAVLERMQARAR